MQLEKLKNVNHKKIIIGGLIVVGVLSTIILTTTRAKYRTTQSINIAKGTINYKPYDFKIMAMYQQKEGSTCTDDNCYEEITERMPSSGYVINESKSYCTLDNKTKDTEAILKTIDGNHVISNLAKNDKCYLYFDKGKDTTVPTISNVEISDITKTSFKITVTASDDIGVTEYYYSKDNGTTYTEATTNTYTFSGLSAGTTYNVKVYVKDEDGNESTVTSKSVMTTADGKSTLDKLGLTSTTGETGFTGPSKTNEGIKSGTDDDGTTYYYRGNVANNWIKFAGFYWRIIRINGDGTIRIIYNGTSPATIGTETQLSSLSAYNSSYNDNAYVGYMYGAVGSSTYAATHANTYDSTIKTTLDNWYKANILEKGFDGKVDKNAGFCNDRQIMSGVHSSYGTTGYGTNATSYAPWGRLYTNNAWKTSQTPTFGCANKSADLFTVSSSTKGNKKLTYPIGLITSDEVVFAGGFGGSNNSGYYLHTNQAYWTMSPCYMTTNDYAGVYNVDATGGLNWSNDVYNSFGVRPVINLRADTQFTGTGTSSNPYIVQ